jgi:hypothetical protein
VVRTLLTTSSDFGADFAQPDKAGEETDGQGQQTAQHAFDLGGRAADVTGAIATIELTKAPIT